MIKLQIICCIIVITFASTHLRTADFLKCNITIRGCTYCNPLDASQCQMCDYNFTVNIQSHTCDCQRAYFLTPDKSHCLVCIDLYGLNCKICTSSAFPDNNTYCAECSPGYYTNNISCCLNSVSNCSNCSFDGTTCYACANGTNLVDGKCTSCRPQCQNCDKDMKCTSCKSKEMYLLNGVCQNCSKAIEGCKMCTDAVTCTNCVSLEYYLKNAACTLCNKTMANCSKCLSSNVCLQCHSGSVVSSDSSSCVLCSDLFLNCLKCSNTKSCDECKMGEQFIDGACRDKSSSGFDWFIILIICAASLLVITIAVCCYIKKCRKTANKQSIIVSDNNLDSSAKSSSDSDNNLRKSFV